MKVYTPEREPPSSPHGEAGIRIQTAERSLPPGNAVLRGELTERMKTSGTISLPQE